MIDICIKHNLWFDRFDYVGNDFSCNGCSIRHNRNDGTFRCRYFKPCNGSITYADRICDECIVKFHCFTREE